MTDRHQEPKDENPNLDPNPDYDNDLEGGGVKRGHTPPESQSASTPPRHTPSRRPPRRNPTLVIIGILLVFMVLFFVPYTTGIWHSCQGCCDSQPPSHASRVEAG